MGEMTGPVTRGAGSPGRVVVVGAGITGLATAWRIHADHPGCDVVVVDAAGRTGGLITTEAFDGLALDCAADAFLARVPEAVALCAELGLAGDLVHPANGSALVLADGVLRRLPAGLVLGVPTDLDALADSGIVSAAGVARAAADLDATAAPGDVGVDDDCSVGALVRSRLGDEVFDKLVAPLLGGVNAGDADELSLAAGAPQLAEVASAPSLIAALRQRAPAPGAAPPVFAGFATGTSTLVNALVAALPAGSVRTATAVTAVTPRPGGGFAVATSAGAIDADAVVLAVPAHVLAPLVAGLPGGLDDVAHGLAALQWASVAMVAMAVDTDRVAHPLDASGYLVPVAERRTVTAASFASTKWAHLARPGRATLRVSAGHAGDDAAVHLDDAELVAAIEADLADHLGLDGPAATTRVTRWWRALPQYRPGHLGRARSWQRQVADTHPGLWLTGASFEGLGIPACIRQATVAARTVAPLAH